MNDSRISGGQRLRAAVSSLCALLLSAVLALPLAGCSGGSSATQDGPREAAEAALQKLSDGGDAAGDLLGDAASSQLGQLGLTQGDVLGALLDGFSYEVGEASVDGQAATVPVKLHVRRLADALGAFGDAYTQAALENPDHTPDESELYGLAGKALLDSLHATSPTDVQVDLALEHTDGAWRLSDAGKQALTSAILGL